MSLDLRAEQNAQDCKIAKFLRQPEANEFFQRVYEKQQQENRSLRTCTDLLGIGRYQGKLEIIDWLLKLKEEE